MSKYSYLILGTGVGRVIAEKLAQYGDTDSITLADLSNDYALDVGRSVLKKYERVRYRSLGLDISNTPEHDLVELFRRFDVVVSAIPAKFDPAITRACIETGTHSCNLGAVLEATKEQLEMDEAAKDAGSCITTDTGLGPGMINVWAQALLDWGGRDVPIDLFMIAGGVPQHPTGPSNYGKMYAAEGTWHMVYDRVVNVRKGQIEYTNAMNTFTRIPTPAILRKRGLASFETMEAFASSGAALAPWDLHETGVRNFTEWTIRWPGFENFVRMHNEVTFKEAFAKLPPTNAEHPDLVYTQVLANWPGGQSSFFEMVDTFDQATGFSAMQRTTGIPAAISARMLAQERLPVGVTTCDRALKAAGLTKEYLDEVKKDLPFTFTHTD